MKLTHKEIEAGRSDAGGFNLAQIKALGFPLPARGWPKAGWPKQLMAMEVSAEQYAEFLSLRGNKKERARRSLPHGIARDSEINFDQPRLKESNVGTSVIARRFMAGESVAILAEDYGVPMSEIETALRFELTRRADETTARSVRYDSPEALANELFEQNGRDLSS